MRKNKMIIEIKRGSDDYSLQLRFQCDFDDVNGKFWD